MSGLSFELTPVPPFVKITGSVDLSAADTDAAENLLRELAVYRLLYYPHESEYAGEVVQAADRLRGRLGEVARSFSTTSTGSALAKATLAMAGICSDFLSEIKRLSLEIKRNYELDKANMEAGIQLMDDQVARVRHYDRVGGADLFANRNLNVMDIQPPGYQFTFLEALGKLRGRFGMVLSMFCQEATTTLPDELVPLVHESAASDS